METASKFMLPAIGFVLTVASGIWLSNTGKPLNTMIFTIHKLIALAAVILTGIQVYKTFQEMGIQILPVVLIVVTGVCVIALFVSGALLSLGKPVDAVLLTIHKVAPVVAVVAMIAVIYLLNTKGIQ
jgi:hypothetical protein